MDINFLLFLQSLRESLGDGVGQIITIVSKIFVEGLVIIPFLVFWCVDKKTGYFINFSYNAAQFLNGVLKVTFCVPRPWIKDPRIIPFGDSISSATGYSFPSGHTQIASSIGGAVGVWQWKRHRWISFVMLGIMLFAGFSRLYFGVHTPQDVVAALLLSFLVVFLVYQLQKWIGDNKKRDLNVMLIGVIVIVALSAYVFFKPYPVVENVDPVKMQFDTFKMLGALLGFMVSGFIERHYIKFSIDGSVGKRVVRGLVGAVPTIILYKIVTPALATALGGRAGNFVGYLLLNVFAFLCFPYLVKKYQDRHKGK